MTQAELRRPFHDDLARLRGRIEHMFHVVLDGMPVVTAALLALDAVAARPVLDADAEVDAQVALVEHEVFDLVARQAPVGADLRFLIASFRIALDVERAGDLLASIARRVGEIDPAALGDGLRSAVEQLAGASTKMLAGAAAAYAGLDAERAAEVVAADDDVDRLEELVLSELFGAPATSAQALIGLGQIARFYERIADHAVVVAQQVSFVVSGQQHPGDPDERRRR